MSPPPTALLGYHWFFGGEVVKGDQRGRELGFPTANIADPAGFGLAQGVYAVRARLGDRLLDGVAAYRQADVQQRAAAVRDLSLRFRRGHLRPAISVALVGHIRGQEMFSGLDELIAAMNRDSRKARDLSPPAAPLSELDRSSAFSPSRLQRIEQQPHQFGLPSHAGLVENARKLGPGGRYRNAALLPPPSCWPPPVAISQASAASAGVRP